MLTCVDWSDDTSDGNVGAKSTSVQGIVIGEANIGQVYIRLQLICDPRETIPVTQCQGFAGGRDCAVRH